VPDRHREHLHHRRRRHPGRPAGPGEHRRHPRTGATPAEPAQLARAGRLPGQTGETGERELRVGGGAGGGEGQRQRQPGAPGHDLVHRLRLGGDPAGAEAAGQQLPGLLRGEDVEADRPRAVSGDQAGQPAAAGHQHQAAGRTGQQRPYLPGVTGVIQQHQHPPPGQHAAVQRRLGVQARRDAGRRHVQRVEEPAYGLGRGHHLPARAGPAQVHVQLPVREPVGHLVRPVHRQRRLAHPRRTGDHRDHHDPLTRHRVTGLQRRRERLGQAAQLRRPAGERDRRSG